MARLPVPGSDANTWGDVLNDFLAQEHNTDGSQKPLAQSKVTNLIADLAATEKTANKGIAGGYAPLDGSSQVPSANLPAKNLYVQQTQPSSPPAGSLWIPTDGSGNPLTIDQWQVFT